MLTPVAKRVLIQPIEVQNQGKILIHNQNQGKILIPNQKPSQFKVIAVGDEVTKVSASDVIYLEKHYGVEIEHEGQKYSVIDEASILAKVKNNE